MTLHVVALDVGELVADVRRQARRVPLASVIRRGIDVLGEIGRRERLTGSMRECGGGIWRQVELGSDLR